MRRKVLVALVALGALCLGVLAIVRGQAWLGGCFIGLGLLRTFMLLQRLRPRKPQPSIRLNIEGNVTRSDGPDDQQVRHR